MAHDRTQVEGPGELGHGMFKPDGAEKLPTKHYPSSGNLGKVNKGKEVTIDGPCEHEKGYHRG